jgi:hypothetical protein
VEETLDLVMHEVLLSKVRALLEDDDPEACGRELLGHHTASSAGADHDEVDRLGRPELRGAHRFSSRS